MDLTCLPWAELSGYLGNDLLRLLLSGSRRLIAKILQDTTEIYLLVGKNTPFPFSVYDFPKLVRFRLVLMSAYYGYPLALNGAHVRPLEGRNLRFLEVGCAQSLSIVFDGLLQHSSFPYLETLICSGSATPISPIHLRQVPPSVTKLQLVQGAHILVNCLISTSEFADALPPGITDLYLVSLNITTEYDEEGRPKSLNWPKTLISLSLDGSLDYYVGLSYLPPCLVDLSICCQYDSGHPLITMAQLPQSLKFIGLHGPDLPKIVIDSPMPPELTHFSAPSIFPSEDAWHFVSRNMVSWDFPEDLPLDTVEERNKMLEHMPNLMDLTVDLKESWPDPEIGPAVKFPNKSGNVVLSRTTTISLAGLAKLGLPNSTQTLIIGDLNTISPQEEPDKCPAASPWNCSPWRPSADAWSILPRELQRLRVKHNSRLCFAPCFTESSMWASLPPTLTFLEISLHAFGGVECFSVLPKTLTELVLEIGSSDDYRQTLAPASPAWRKERRLGQFLPPTLKALTFQISNAAYPWTHWIKDYCELNPALPLTTLSIQMLTPIDKLRPTTTWIPPRRAFTEEELVADLAENLFPEVWFSALPAGLKCLTLSLNPMTVIPVDAFRHLPHRLKEINLFHRLLLSDAHLAHLPTSISRLHLNSMQGITPRCYSFLPALIHSIFILAHTPTLKAEFAVSRDAYRKDPLWQDCDIWPPDP